MSTKKLQTELLIQLSTSNDKRLLQLTSAAVVVEDQQEKPSSVNGKRTPRIAKMTTHDVNIKSSIQSTMKSGMVRDDENDRLNQLSPQTEVRVETQASCSSSRPVEENNVESIYLQEYGDAVGQETDEQSIQMPGAIRVAGILSRDDDSDKDSEDVDEDSRRNALDSVLSARLVDIQAEEERERELRELRTKVVQQELIIEERSLPGSEAVQKQTSKQHELGVTSPRLTDTSSLSRHSLNSPDIPVVPSVSVTIAEAVESDDEKDRHSVANGLATKMFLGCCACFILLPAILAVVAGMLSFGKVSNSAASLPAVADNQTSPLDAKHNNSETDVHQNSNNNQTGVHQTTNIDQTNVPQTTNKNQTEVPQATRAEERECFQTMEDLHKAVDAYLLDNSNITDVAKRYGWPISVWCVSEIEDFSSAFSALRNPLASTFNEDLSGWDTSGGTDMHNMFKEASNFSQPLNTWDVSNVRTMRGMFKNAERFNGNISGWNVSLLEDASDMFFLCHDFNQDLSSWDVGRVAHMGSMFRGNAAFNSDISKWNVSNVRRMKKMFDGASSFDIDLSPWDVSNVETMERMFHATTSYTGRGLSNWNVSRVTNFRDMFKRATSFGKENLCEWVDVINNASAQDGRNTLNTTYDVADMFLETACAYQDDPMIVYEEASDSFILASTFCSQCPADGNNATGLKLASPAEAIALYGDVGTP